MDKTTVSIVVWFNDENVHTTPDVILKTSFALQVKKAIIDQVDGMITTLEQSKKL